MSGASPPDPRLARRLQLAVEAAGLGLWTWDLATNRSTCDQRTRELFGYPPEPWVPEQEQWLARVHPEDRLRIRELNARCLAGEISWDAEYRIVRPDGEVRWVHEATRREDASRLVGFVRDVTLEVQAREALEQHGRQASRRAQDLGDLLDSLSDIVVRALPDTTRLYVNAAYERVFGLPRESVVGTRYVDRLAEAERVELLARLRQLTPARPVQRYLREESGIDGGRLWIEWDERGVFDDDGRLVEIRSIGRDLTERVLAQRRLEASEARLTRALAVARRGLCDFDRRHGSTYLTAAAAELLGLPRETVSLPGDLGLLGFAYEDDRGQLEAALDRINRGDGDRVEIEYRVRRGDGSLVWIEAAIEAVERDASGRPLRVLALIADISERRARAEELEYLARHDPLTGLPNRAAYERSLTEALARARAAGRSLALMMVDLDGFKEINDRHGHPVGDLVLQEVAGRLRRALRKHDLLARLGGDEFVIVVEDWSCPAELVGIAERALQSLAEPIQLGELRLPIAASVGIATSDDGDDAEGLRTRADQGLYRAKRAGRSRYHVVESV
jgi:diguanylate cyclase (GGDEF)-like protein/PAS domain S-box-containing protein